ASCIGVTPKIMETRASTHIPIIAQYARLYDVDPTLVKAIITVESCFDKYAVSRAGAKGLMQLMPDTAKGLGVYNVFNPKDNMRGGIRYFRQMMDRFQQDTKLALAAYNAGPLAVEKYKGVPPYPETEGYVKKVLLYYSKYGGKTNDAKQKEDADKTEASKHAEQSS
ncbi:MAG: lytic transglycosylase domain-containing protein, partial [Gammaproteobacteria bacterium]